MCMVLDTSMHGLYLSKDNLDMKPIRKWLRVAGRLVYSDHEKIKKEMKGKIIQTFHELIKAGRVKKIPKEDVDKQMKSIQNNKYNLKSNDLHVLALVKASGAKILCTSDSKLQGDFKKLFKKGHIYKNKNHKHLLHKNTCPF